MDLTALTDFERDLNDLESLSQFLTSEEQLLKSAAKSAQDGGHYHLLGCPLMQRVGGRRFNPFQELTQAEFQHSYRFSKENMKRIIEILRDDLEVDPPPGYDQKKKQVPVNRQIMAALRYWGGTEHPSQTCKAHGICLRTLLRISKRVSKALALKASRYIRMPCLLAEKEKITEAFYHLAHMPQVIGAVSHFHIKCTKISPLERSILTTETTPSTTSLEQATSFKNNDSYTLHVQLVSDAHWKIRDLDCRTVVLLQDTQTLTAAGMFAQSRIKERFEQNEFRGRLLLGGIGHKCTTFLYTPVRCARTLPDRAYNGALELTYEPVRHCLKLWHQRFGILRGYLSGTTNTVRHLVISLALLHNMAIEWHDPTLESYKETLLGRDVTRNSSSDCRSRAEFIKNHFCHQET